MNIAAGICGRGVGIVQVVERLVGRLVGRLVVRLFGIVRG